MTPSREALDKLMAGRLLLKRHAPYFMTALLSLSPRPTDRIDTCAVTKNLVLLYNPAYFLKLTDIQVATRLWHEIQHVLRRSFDRLPGVDAQTSNICTDLAINSSGKGPWDFNPDGLLPKNYGLPDGLTAEEYYAKLPRNKPMPNPRCGGCAGNPSNAEVEAEADAEIGRSPSEQHLMLKQVARDIKQHQKEHGTIAGGWTEWADAMLAPSKVPWQALLASHVRYSMAMASPGGGSDESYEYPSSRSYTGPPGKPSVLKPGPIDPEPNVALALDTSGSMGSNREIPLALRECRMILQSLGQSQAWLLEVDTKLGCEPRRVTAADLAKLEVHGRGGTDFRPAFEAAQKLPTKPSVLVYLTDGWGPAPEEKPQGIDVVWCLVGRGSEPPVPWGVVVKVEDD